MLDFLTISTRNAKRGIVEIYPKFIIKKSSDLMIRGGDFYAIWVEERGLWSTDEEDVIKLVDKELDAYAEKNRGKFDEQVRVLHMWDAGSGIIDAFHKYCQKQMRDSYHMLDETLVFANTPTSKKEYSSKRLPYSLEAVDTPAYDKLMSTLYSEEERHKIEWAIGAIITGESKRIQKFMVLYGEAGTGKSTVLNIIQDLFDGYYTAFDAKALGSSNNSFALEAFKTNPLVAIQHDGDLSKIEDNTRLNSLVSHELMTINEKFKSTYTNRFKCFLFMGTNKPVKITDGKSGLIRRLIDVSPSGKKLRAAEYEKLISQVKFELGGIAHHCREVYLKNPGKYNRYIPIAMLGASNDFYNFVIDSYSVFLREDGTTLKAAWEMYKTYCDEAKVPYPYSQRNFKEELRNYFWEFKERYQTDDGTRLRSYYSRFRTDRFDNDIEHSDKNDNLRDSFVRFEYTTSVLDSERSECPAQYATTSGIPRDRWDDVATKLSDLDTSKLHYVKLPGNHIVIDFDIKDEQGNKQLSKNIEAASKWPATYAEVSKSGCGVHLHYIYTGDATKLSRIYDDSIEIKIFTGNSALRRKLTKCNNLPIASIGSGLPLKEENKLINWEGVKNEKILRTMIKRNLAKEYHDATKPSVDYIYKLLEEAYTNGLHYDVSDLQNAVVIFAANSTNQSDYCIRLVDKMHFKSDDPSLGAPAEDGTLIFYDVEVFPNLLLVSWKRRGLDQSVVHLFNPKPSEIEELIRYNLIGFNNRSYDNHILYARLMGYNNQQIYELSQKLVSKDRAVQRKAKFGEAFNLSYTDVHDFAKKKQSLKKWEIELGIHHQELGLPWDQPVDEKLWSKVADYCGNDVVATEAVFDHLSGDWTARQILAELSGMTVNDTTNTHTTRIIFGSDRNPNLVYTDLSIEFPGYEFVYDDEKKQFCNMYRGTDVGFGGYVYARPGIYTNVALLDVASLHPNSIVAMNCFGEYTKNFKDILDARIFIKHREFDKARTMLNGRLAKYLDDESKADDLAQALKIAINSVYGLTAASFDNPFRDIRNKNNIVALRGALFMRTLQDEIRNRGFTVAHIKTDSIKIPNATKEIIDFCMKFASKYGYTFEHEATYDRMCLVNQAVYIAKYKNGKKAGEWTATGTQFQIPYVFKTLFSKEQLEFSDLTETKEVKQGVLELDLNESLPEGEHNYRFIGRVGNFCPIKPGCNGGVLYRKNDGKYYAATGTKDFRWLESELVKTLQKEDDIDLTYYEKLADDAVATISEYGDFDSFVNDDPYYGPDDDIPY